MAGGRQYRFEAGFAPVCRHCGEKKPPYTGRGGLPGLFRANIAWVRRHTPACVGPDEPVMAEQVGEA